MSTPPKFTAPDFAAPKPAPGEPAWRRYRAWALLPALVLLLVLQVLVADRVRLAADPAWRPRIVALCGVLACSVPDWREPAAFHVTAREMRPHPNAVGALLLSATFRNDAAFDQPWPLLQVQLANPEGEPLGLRRFTPREYLGGDPSSARIAPGQSAAVSLAIMDPGKRAVSFDLAFP
jgi:hypothetical protein